MTQKMKSWFYPVTNKSKHELCLNYGEWDECCLKCHEPWCFYSQHTVTKQIMWDKAWKSKPNSSTIKNDVVMESQLGVNVYETMSYLR